MESDYLTAFLDRKKTPIIKKKRHTYLAYHGLEEAYTYVLKKGVVKTSIILKDGREFNLSYIVSPDIISLLRDEVSNYTSLLLISALSRKRLAFIGYQGLYFGNMLEKMLFFKIMYGITTEQNYRRVLVPYRI